MNAKLGGCLIGYGLKKKDGTFKKVMFDKPIHNTITKHCLNNLLMFNGTNATPTGNYTGNYLSLFVKSSQTSDRYGVINSCCLGDGTGETSVNDTDLKHRVSAQTTTKKNGNNWCGTSLDGENVIIKLRVSHTHAISQNFTVKEIGWYNAINESGVLNYTLSARVQLDEFIDVENGDTFYSIYELSISFQGVEKFNDFAGLGVGGYKVNGLCGYTYGSSTSYPFPFIDANGYPITNSNGGVASYTDRFIQFSPIWCTNYLNLESTIITDWNKTKAYQSTVNVLRDNMRISYSINNLNAYIEDSYKRDCELIINPSALGSDIYGISVFGTYYRFGTFDENDNFTPTPVTINGALRLTVRQSWSTDLLTPAA